MISHERILKELLEQPISPRMDTTTKLRNIEDQDKGLARGQMLTGLNTNDARPSLLVSPEPWSPSNGSGNQVSVKFPNLNQKKKESTS